MKNHKANLSHLATNSVANVPINWEIHTNNKGWKKQMHFLLFIFLVLVSGKIFSQDLVSPPTNNLPMYQDGKLYFQLKLNSNVVINSKDNIVNDPGGIFQFLFSKYGVTATERPYAVLETANLIKTYRISFNQSQNVDDFIQELSAVNAHVEFAEKVPAVYTFVVPNEMGSNPTPQASSLYHLAMLNSNLASNIYIAPGNVTGNAVVAIVDDAVLTTHQDLNGNTGSANRDVTTGAANPSDPNPPLPNGNAGNFTHGTHVAGIAGAVTNNGVGVASIGWNNKLMCVKTSDCIYPGGGLQNPYGGLAWAAANGAKVINMSWGSTAYSQVDYNVVAAAKNNNIVLIAAAGNSGINIPAYPAAYGEGTTGQAWEVIDKRLVVAVAALDASNNMSVWSNGAGSSFGSWVDIAAYGTNIMSTLAASDASGNPINNQYGLLSGTSMAAPMVTGIAGIMRSYNASKTADQIIDCLIGTANPDIYGNNHPANAIGTLGSGRADASAALRCISSNCNVNPIVIITPSSQNLCASGTITLTANLGASSYLWNTAATTNTISINTPGTYSVVATYPGNCTATASIVFSPPPTLNVALSTNTAICPGYSVAVLGATGNYTAITWQPGGMTTSSIVVNPTVATVYTVTANPSCGGSSLTINVNPSTYTQPLANAPYSILSGPILAGIYTGPSNNPPPFVMGMGHFIVSSNVTVNTTATFNYADVYMAPNVKITVPNGSAFNIVMSQLRTCGTDMWQGIEVNDGAQLTTDNQNIIADAVTAVSSTHTPVYSAGVPPAIIHLRSTVFNKNYTDVSVTNFYDFTAPTSYSNTLTIDNCVFTCRNFNNFWVSAGFTYGSSYAWGIRAATISNPGLGTPYGVYNYPFTTLKAPYTGQTSSCAIFLTSSAPASNSAGNDFVIGDASYYTNFNLFDNHNVFVNAQNCNVTLKNNVFQNQLQATVAPQNVSYSGPWQLMGGWNNNSAAVMHRTFNSSLNTKLDMTASATNLGNRFFDCIRAVEGYNIDQFKMSNGIIRSTHTADGTNIPGTSGLNLKTSHVNYDIHDNEFSNIKNAVNVPLTAGYVSYLLSPNNPPITVYGNYLTALAIYNNQFSAGNTSIGNFMNQAVNVTNDLGVQPNSPSPLPLLTPQLPNYGWVLYPWQPSGFHPTGLGIINNQINGAWNGINVNGFTGFPVWVAQNNISLVEKPNATQYGIRLDNGTSTAQRQQSVWLNNVSCMGNTGANVSLIYCSMNSGNTSPIVNCNDVKDATKGFVFAGTNIGATNVLGLQWRGNKMQNLKYGMRLQGYVTPQNVTLQGIIGQQGDAVVAMGNYWNGNTWSGSNYNIWTESSPAAYSPLYHINSPLSSMNMGANPSVWVYDQYNVFQNSNNDFFCDWTQYFVEPNPDPLNPVYDSDLQVYLTNSQKYHFLRYNQAERDAHPELDTWYNEMKNNDNFEALELIQEDLYKGDYNMAKTRIAAMEAKNYIEQNTIAFYNLHANYVKSISEGTDFAPDDGSALAQIAQLCPIEYGASIYKARALYNSIYNTIVNYDDCNATANPARQASNMQNKISEQNLNAELYPNPASSRLTIKSAGSKDDLTIRIFDVTGRVVLSKQVKTENFIGVVDLDLVNGAYVATITNSQNQVLTKKLVIAK